MEAQLDDDQTARAQRSLLSSNGDELIDLILRLNLKMSVAGSSAETLEHARELGWVSQKQTALTPMGTLVADPIREYRFWLDRGRRVHGEPYHELLRASSYAGKAVLEPGSGFGCNLFALMPYARRIVGLEPTKLYRQFTSLFASREGLPAPEVKAGTAESMPFEDGEFDVVVCYSAHQYMDIRRALNEMARVLRPGGQLQIVGGTLNTYVAESWRRARSGQIRQLKADLLTVINTLAYQALGRRLITPRGPSMTTAPIYPRTQVLDKWLSEAGFRIHPEMHCLIGNDTLFIADKP